MQRRCLLREVACLQRRDGLELADVDGLCASVSSAGRRPHCPVAPSDPLSLVAGDLLGGRGDCWPCSVGPGVGSAGVEVAAGAMPIGRSLVEGVDARGCTDCGMAVAGDGAVVASLGGGSGPRCGLSGPSVVSGPWAVRISGGALPRSSHASAAPPRAINAVCGSRASWAASSVCVPTSRSVWVCAVLGGNPCTARYFSTRFPYEEPPYQPLPNTLKIRPP